MARAEQRRPEVPDHAEHGSVLGAAQCRLLLGPRRQIRSRTGHFNSVGTSSVDSNASLTRSLPPAGGSEHNCFELTRFPGLPFL
jgi:hypothetical protein